jgi:hypothetical protein
MTYMSFFLTVIVSRNNVLYTKVTMCRCITAYSRSPNYTLLSLRKVRRKSNFELYIYIYLTTFMCRLSWNLEASTSYMFYNEQIFINEFRMLQQTQMLQRPRRNTNGRCSTRVRMTCRAFPRWLERQSSSLLTFVRFSYQYSSVIYLFVQCVKVKLIIYIIFTIIYFILCYICPV